MRRLQRLRGHPRQRPADKRPAEKPTRPLTPGNDPRKLNRRCPQPSRRLSRQTPRWQPFRSPRLPRQNRANPVASEPRPPHIPAIPVTPSALPRPAHPVSPPARRRRPHRFRQCPRPRALPIHSRRAIHRPAANPRGCDRTAWRQSPAQQHPNRLRARPRPNLRTRRRPCKPPRRGHLRQPRQRYRRRMSRWCSRFRLRPNLGRLPARDSLPIRVAPLPNRRTPQRLLPGNRCPPPWCRLPAPRMVGSA
jgi:hypothetical protein